MESNEIAEQEMVCLFGHPQARKKIELWSFVLQAVGVYHEVRQVDGLWEIYTFDPDGNFARKQIADFESENVDWPAPKPVAETLDGDEISALMLMGALVFFYSITGPWSQHTTWFNVGAVSSEKILRGGEWWRLITGLTLHADASHLLGNVFFGGLLIYFLARRLGRGATFQVILTTGFVGNALNLVCRHGEHLSVGFSTSVFGLVGTLCSVRWFRGGFSARELLLSLGAAFGLLALLGSGGEKTDFGAHFWGMVVGFVLGWVVSLPLAARFFKSQKIQAVLFLFFVVMIWISWYRALRY